MCPLVLNVGMAVHDADWNWKDVNSPFTRLYYVTEGEAMVKLSDGTHRLRAGHMYFIPAYARHTNICSGRFVHYYLHIYEEHKDEEDWLEQWTFPFEIEAGGWELSLFRRLCEINPHMSLQKSDPSTYDNNPTLMQSLMKNRQRAEEINQRALNLTKRGSSMADENTEAVYIKDGDDWRRIWKA